MKDVGHTLFKWLLICTAEPYQTHVCSSLKDAEQWWIYFEM